MLNSISISNFILVHDLVIDFHSGFTVISGETGAGKSIILNAIAMLLGKRATPRFLRDEGHNAIISGEFVFAKDHPVLQRLLELELYQEGNVIIRRVIRTDGTSRAFINNHPVNATLLAELASELVEICGQHDTKGLFDKSSHIDIVDKYIGHVTALQELGAVHEQMRVINADIVQLQAQKDTADMERNYLEHIVAELEQCEFSIGEHDELQAKRRLLKDKSNYKAAIDKSLKALTGSDGAREALFTAVKSMSKYEDFFTDILSLLESVSIEVDEAISALEDKAYGFSEAGDLPAIEERLFAIHSMARKHQVQPDVLPAFLEEQKAKLARITNLDATIANLQKQLAGVESSYISLATSISQARQQAALEVTQNVNAQLQDLEMSAAEFKVQVLQAEDKANWNAKGVDDVTFLIATNKGSRMDDIRKIASGGELSRIMLAIKAALARISGVQTVIFDEIDTGISGSVSNKVGRKLAQISQDRQTLVVTHQPQVAAYSNHHYLVAKSSDESNTSVSVTKLNEAQKVSEIARMLSGEEVSSASIQAAEKLVEDAVC
jgi:DNA repair protein RecN (Recombination protein N)